MDQSTAAAQSLLLGRALVLEARRGGAAPRPAPPLRSTGASRAVRGGLAGWMLFYTFGLPMLGLQDMGNVHMFASLRLHGGSNHIFLPTGLLQRWLHDAAPASPWAGGVVRVEATNLTWVGNTFAEHMHPRTQRVIRELAGVPGEYIWSAKATTAPRAHHVMAFSAREGGGLPKGAALHIV